MPQRRGDQTSPIQVLPFSLENLCTALPTPKTPLDDCPICKAIGGGGASLVKGGELEYDTIPDGVQNLTYFLRLGEYVETNWLERCPQCERLYYCENSYEFLIGGSEDYESCSIVSPEDVLKLAEVSWANATGQGELHAYADGTWAIFREPKSIR
ncbi:MAG: hypothetical protein QM758_04215 [Armatimonas sp.]